MASEWTVDDDDELAGVTLGTGKVGSLPGLSYLLLFLAAQLSQLGTILAQHRAGSEQVPVSLPGSLR